MVEPQNEHTSITGFIHSLSKIKIEDDKTPYENIRTLVDTKKQILSYLHNNHITRTQNFLPSSQC